MVSNEHTSVHKLVGEVATLACDEPDPNLIRTLSNDDPAMLKFRQPSDITPSALVPGIKQLDFWGDSSDLVFKSSYACTISSAPQGFRESVLFLLIGAMVNDGEPSDKSISKLAGALPNLQTIDLKSNGITDTGMEACFSKCHNLRDFSVSTNKGVTVSLKGTAFRNLAKNPDWCPNLRRMELEGYHTLGSTVRKALSVLSQARKDLTIETTDMDRLLISVWHGGEETVEEFDEDSDDSGGSDFNAHIDRRGDSSGSEPEDEIDRALAWRAQNGYIVDDNEGSDEDSD